MPICLFPSRPLRVHFAEIAAACLLWGGLGSAWAVDKAPLTSPARTSAKAPAVASDPQDVLVHIRQRLMDTMGAQTEPDHANGGEVLRVPSRNDTARPAQRKATRPRASAWTYAEGPGGPAQWARLRPEFAVCGKGQRQSPIDIRDVISVDHDEVEFDYQPLGFQVNDTGRTVQVNVAAGSHIDVMGRRYLLRHLQFRQPSETRINGRQFDMSVQLVHQDAEGRTAIVAVMLDRTAMGPTPQPVVQQVWNNLPLEKGDALSGLGTLDVGGLLPVQRGHFAFMGSHTSPPCTEGVLWVVMQQPVPITASQLDVFTRLYPMNARPIQPANGRLIKGSMD